MPLWLRKITFNLIQEHFDKENEAIEKQNNMLKNKGNSKDISRPNITPPPNYIIKAPKK